MSDPSAEIINHATLSLPLSSAPLRMSGPSGVAHWASVSASLARLLASRVLLTPCPYGLQGELRILSALPFEEEAFVFWPRSAAVCSL